VSEPWSALIRVVPRATVYAARAARPTPGHPVPGLRRSPWTWAQVLVDDAVVTVAHVRGRDESHDLARLDADARDAVEGLTRAGAFADRSVLFPIPPPVAEARLTSRRRYGRRFEHVSFASEWRPPPGLPRADDWLAVEGAEVAHAFVLRHKSPRPWVVALHGYGTGEPYDLWWMGSLAAHHQLGVNVMNVILPRHGPRSRVAIADRFPGIDPIVNVYGFSQAIWDIRRAMTWARQQSDTPIGVYGISLGAYAASLLAGVEPGLACVVAGIPVVDFGQLISRHVARYEGDDHALVRAVRNDAAVRLNRLVSPVAYAPLVPHEGRFMYAAVGDRMATPGQAVALWRHWDAPETLWVQGSHIGAPMARGTRRFVFDAFRSRGIAAP
jgi:hypothetical protein